jgi:hypothetical protein
MQAQGGYCYSNYIYGNPSSCHDYKSGTTPGTPGNSFGCQTGYICTDNLYPDDCQTGLRYVYMTEGWSCPNTPATSGYVDTWAQNGSTYAEGYGQITDGLNFLDFASEYQYCNGAFSGQSSVYRTSGC